MKLFQTLPLMGILRGVREEELDFIAETAADAGVTALEITMNTQNAPSLVKKLDSLAAGRFSVGAGTVLSMSDLRCALNSGASFIVMPVLIPEVTEYCAKSNIPVFPGAFSPQEIFNAWNAGATMVKVFPSGLAGPRYFRDIKGPFEKIPLMACGGVTAENLAEFFSSGADAVSFGGSIFRRKWLEEREAAQLSSALDALVQAFKNQS